MKCKFCKKQFTTKETTWYPKGKKQKYCSVKCSHAAQKGRKWVFTEGRKKMIEDRIKKFKDSNKKQNYRNVHKWIIYRFGKADHCDLCGKIKIKKDSSYQFHWSCRNGKPDRNLQNWWQLCVLCHARYDREFLEANFYRSKTKKLKK